MYTVYYKKSGIEWVENSFPFYYHFMAKLFAWVMKKRGYEILSIREF